MAKIKTYSNPTAFRRALEDRLSKISTSEGIDIPRLRRQVSFDRLLARLFALNPAPWVLKGGYAMQLRTPSSRGTKDVDLAIRDGKLLSEDPEQQDRALSEILLKQAALDLNDFFQFTITGPIKDINAAPYGGARFHVEAIVDARSFEKFHLDIGIGDVWVEPLETLTSRAFLDFMGLEAQKFPVIPKEQQFAEKIHAYSLPRDEGRQNSRVKDLVDMVLLISAKEMDSTKLQDAIAATFKRRSTHEFNSTLATPPTNWSAPFADLAKECTISTEMDSAFQLVQTFIHDLKL